MVTSKHSFWLNKGIVAAFWFSWQLLLTFLCCHKINLQRQYNWEASFRYCAKLDQSRPTHKFSKLNLLHWIGSIWISTVKVIIIHKYTLPADTAYKSLILVTKKFSEWKQAHIGMEPSKTNQTKWNDTTTLIIPIHLVPFCQVWFAFVRCVHRSICSWVGGSAGCVVGGFNVYMYWT